MKRALWSLAILVIVPVVVYGEAPAPPRSQPHVPTRGPDHLRDVATDLALLATANPPTPADLQALETAGFTSAAYSTYIDELLKRPSVSAVAGRILRIGGNPGRALLADTVLKQQTVGSDVVYYIHQPCDVKQAESVKPWWALDTKVLVCPDAHRPTVFRAPDGNYCSGVYAAPYQPNSPCGCGPNLIRCLRNEQDRAAFSKALMAESGATINHVVSKDLPLETLFTSEESFRPPLAELLYQRWKIENRDVASLEALGDWRKLPETGAWSKRPQSKAGQHAGVFTNHFTPQGPDSQRLKVSGFLDILWCENQDSLRVETKTVLDVAAEVKGNLRGHVGWQELASRPLCTTCHARIDYAVQFFTGLHWFYKGLHYVAEEQQDAVGPLYLRDIDDPRGKAPRNPQGFIKLALAQPEYPSCMARDFLEHAFGGAGDPSLHALDTALQGIVKRKGSYRELMKATLEKYKDRALAAVPAQAKPVEPRTTAARVAAITKWVDDRCGSCHDAGDGEPPGLVLKDGNWCKTEHDCARTAGALLDAMVFDRMPKERPLAATDKRRFFDLVAPLAWPAVNTRAMAQRYFLDGPQAPPAHRTDAILNRVKAAGTSTKPPPPVANTIAAPRTFSATTAAQAAIMAVHMCREAPDPKACVATALDHRSFEK
jgi:hypothetical protein